MSGGTKTKNLPFWTWESFPIVHMKRKVVGVILDESDLKNDSKLNREGSMSGWGGGVKVVKTEVAPVGN